MSKSQGCCSTYYNVGTAPDKDYFTQNVNSAKSGNVGNGWGWGLGWAPRSSFIQHFPGTEDKIQRWS